MLGLVLEVVQFVLVGLGHLKQLDVAILVHIEVIPDFVRILAGK